MQKLLILALLLLAGCNRAPAPSDVGLAEVTRYVVGPALAVREFRLSDGTRCVVVSSGDGGLDCDWRNSATP